MHADATAVAQETVRRAKLNFQNIIEGLIGLGYRFAESHGDRTGMISDPPENITTQLDEFEHDLRGPVPLVLRAWYQQIGSVSLMGSHPIFCPEPPARAIRAASPIPAQFRSIRDQVSPDPFMMDPFDPSLFGDFRRAADPARRGVEAEGRLREFDEMMAHMRASIPSKSIEVFAQTEERLRPMREKLEQQFRRATEPMVFQLALGPDSTMKCGESGDSYYVALPDENADFLVRGLEETFVHYLRRTFRCAGFAGWDGRPDTPLELVHLSSKLLPV